MVTELGDRRRTAKPSEQKCKQVKNIERPATMKSHLRKSKIHQAAFRGNSEAVKRHLVAGADLNAKNEWGDGESTPLHYAAFNGHKEITELLIAKGADVNANSDNDEIPLDWAIRGKHSEVADLLRKHGGNNGSRIKS